MFGIFVASPPSDKKPGGLPNLQARKDTDAAPSARILIVEDEFLLAVQAEEALAAAGFQVVGVAASSDEALQLAASEHPDLVIMDIRLSGPDDGVHAAKQLFKRQNLRCLFVTAFQDAATQGRAEAAKPLGWLNKPYSSESLVRATRKALAAAKSFDS